MYNILQQREILHLLFLRHLAQRIQPATYALKGGANLRFFYKSPRYSEDMDIDVQKMEVFKLKEIVMDIITSKAFLNMLKTYQIENLIPPNISKAKQTETVQRFKMHLITSSGDDIFTKIEFSKRAMKLRAEVGMVDSAILQSYKLPPLLVAHYPAEVAIAQKISAIADRSVPQPRDVFDVFILHTQAKTVKAHDVEPAVLEKASKRVFEITYEQYRDTVLNYLNDDNRRLYQQREVWEQMQLTVANLIDESAAG